MAETQSLVIRFARLREAAKVADLSRKHIEHGLRWRYRPARIRQLIKDPESIVIVADIKGRIAGFAILSLDSIAAHLNLLAVVPEFRRSKIAARMLTWLTRSCQVAGIGRINLEVREKNKQAIRFYRRNGYEIVGRRRGYYDGIENAVLMSHRLISKSQEEQRPK